MERLFVFPHTLCLLEIITFAIMISRINVMNFGLLIENPQTYCLDMLGKKYIQLGNIEIPLSVDVQQV